MTILNPEGGIIDVSFTNQPHISCTRFHEKQNPVQVIIRLSMSYIWEFSANSANTLYISLHVVINPISRECLARLGSWCPLIGVKSSPLPLLLHQLGQHLPHGWQECLRKRAFKQWRLARTSLKKWELRAGPRRLTSSPRPWPEFPARGSSGILWTSVKVERGKAEQQPQTTNS